MSKPTIDGVHFLPCGAELTMAGGEPVSVKFCGASADAVQNEIEAFAELWIEDIVEDDEDRLEMKIEIDAEQPTHLYTDVNGQRRVVLGEGLFMHRGVQVSGTFLMNRYEVWLPYRVNGVWYSPDGDVIEATLVSLTPEVEA